MGDAWTFSSLSRLLKEGPPIYGLAGIDRSHLTSIERLAAQYIEAIRQVQPLGPYRLAGYCSGGLVAYEMAYQLIGTDTPVAFLGMIDSHRPRNDPGNVCRTDEVTAAVTYLQYHFPKLELTKLQEMSCAPDVGVLLEHCRKPGVLPVEVDSKQLRIWTQNARISADASERYYPQRLPIPIHLFATAPAAGRDNIQGWADLAGENLFVHPVGGADLTSTQPNRVQPIAEAITCALEEAERGEQNSKEAAYSPTITIQVGKRDSHPIFCAPGAGANVICFMSLAEALGKSATVHGLQPRGLSGTFVPHATVAAAARANVDAVRKISPRGPYRLLGHSFGGWVVFEMACQLLAAGEVVRPVVLLDTQAPSAVQIKPRYYGRVSTLLKLIAILEEASGKMLDVTRKDLEGLGYEAQHARLMLAMKAAGLLPPVCKIDVIRSLVRVFSANLNTAYVPATPYGGEVILIQAQERSIGRDWDEEIDFDKDSWADNWKRHAPHVVQLKTPGSHMTMLKQPSVDLIAAQILRAWGD